jgi:hypothetical protein
LINYIYSIFTPEEKQQYFGTNFQRKICVSLLDEFIKRYNEIHGLQVSNKLETQTIQPTPEPEIQNEKETPPETVSVPVANTASLGGKKTAKHKNYKQKTLKQKTTKGKKTKGKTIKQKRNRNNSVKSENQ